MSEYKDKHDKEIHDTDEPADLGTPQPLDGEEPGGGSTVGGPGDKPPDPPEGGGN
jgi:hypothetical protein